MADGQSEYRIDIKTAADLRAAEAYKRAIENAQKAAKSAGQENAELARRLEATDKALQSNAARAIRLSENLKRVAEAQKQVSSGDWVKNAQLSLLDRNIEKLTRLKEAHEKLTAARASGNGIGLGFGLGTGLSDARALNSELKGLGSSGGAFAALGGGIAGLVRGGAGAIAGAAAGFVSLAAAYKLVAGSIREYAATEDALVNMQLALASQGKFSKEAAAGIAELAAQFEKKTNISDTTWINQFTRLIQYGGRTENINQLAATLKNLAGIMQGDVEGAASLMIRALNGNYRGFEQLGIKIDENASALENWHSIVQQSDRGAGILEKQTQTLSGAFDKLGVAFGNFTKAGVAGVSLQNILKTAITVNAERLQYWADKIGFTIPPLEDLNNAANVTTRTVEDLATSTNKSSDRFKRLAEEADRTAKKVDQVKKAIQQLHGLDDSEAEARKNLELALVDDEEKRTGNTLGAARKRASIQARYGADRARRANESDVAQLAVDNRLAGQIRARQNYLTGAVAYYDRKGDTVNAAKAREELKAFRENEAPHLDAIRLSGAERMAAYQSRNRVYAFESATAAVQANTTERGIRDQLADAITGGGQGPRVFKDLANTASYIPEAINTAQNAQKLFRELVQVYGVNSAQIQELRQQIADINSRQRKGREL